MNALISADKLKDEILDAWEEVDDFEQVFETKMSDWESES